MDRDANHHTHRLGNEMRRPPRSAIVLVLVLIVVAMVALAGFSFSELMLTENKATHVHGDSLRLEQAIGSGVEFLQLFCEQPPQVRAAAGGSFDNPNLFRAVPLSPDERSTNQATHQLCFSVVSPLVEDAQSTRVRFGVEDESGRLHLADVLRWDQQQPGDGRKALMKLPGMTEPVADAILDWVDPDSTPRGTGAENEYYTGLEQPYSPRNALPESIEELLLVKGVTRELLFGPDANYNHQIEPYELNGPQNSAPRASRSTAITPWASLLTLYSGWRNLNSEGGPRIDLNAVDLMKLHQQLSVALDARWASFIVALRRYGLYAGNDPGTSDSPPVDNSVPARFVFGSALDLIGARVAIPGATSSQPPKVVASPISNDSQGMGQELSRLLDKTTTINLPVVRGGVSLNHASVAVLSAVPGIDDALAGRIVAACQGQGPQNSLARRFPTWLLSEGVADLTQMKTLMPNVCAEGDVVRAEVIGHFTPTGQSARVEVVIDATTIPARQVAWKDLRLFGPAYPQEWFSDGASTNDYDPRDRGRKRTGSSRPASSRGTH